MAVLSLVLGAGLILSAARAQPPPPITAAKVEAVYLFNFARFVNWPPEDFEGPESAVIVGILGRDPFGSFLDNVVEGERIENRSIVIRRFATVRDIGACHILYISTSENERLDEILRALSNRHVLTVSDMQDFAHRGGIVQFLPDRERIRFRINLQRAKDSRLELSAKLLRPAEVVMHSVPELYADAANVAAAIQHPRAKLSLIEQATSQIRRAAVTSLPIGFSAAVTNRPRF
ncbi:MAG: YfiR family protein [Opitutus sp.]